MTTPNDMTTTTAAPELSPMDVHYSSKTNEWATPQSLFDSLHREFDFTLDAAATSENAKCPRYLTQDDDGLSRSWQGERVWCNPPYGREIGRWVAKCHSESRDGAIVVCLIPARTDTRYWHDHVMQAAEIRLVRGRLRFGDSTGNAPFPNAIVIFDRLSNGAPEFKSYEAPKS